MRIRFMTVDCLKWDICVGCYYYSAERIASQYLEMFDDVLCR